MKTFVDAVYWLMLTLWIAVLITAGVSATATFTVLPDLDLTVAGFEAVDPGEHGRIAAGHVMESIFTFVDVMQFVAAAFVIALVIVQWCTHRTRRTSLANIVRLAAILLAAGLLLGRATVVTPTMNADLRAYWSNARAGQLEAARVHRADFDAAHPTASRLLSATLVCLVVALVASPAALAPPRTPGLEKPDLLETR